MYVHTHTHTHTYTQLCYKCSIYTQQKKKVNTFSSSDFSYKNVIQANKYQIKGNLILFHPVRVTLRMSEHIHFSLPRGKSKNWKKGQYAIDV